MLLFIPLTISILVTPALPVKEGWTQTVEQDKKQAADRLFEAGLNHYRNSQIEAALKAWQEALQLYQQAGDRFGESQALGNVGLAYRLLGNYPQAIAVQQERLKLVQSLGDRKGEAEALSNLGTVYHRMSEFRKAIQFHEQSLAISQQLRDRKGEGISLGNLGIAYGRLGEYAKALEYQEQRLVIVKELGDRLGEGQVLTNLGIIYQYQGNYGRAADLFQQSLTLVREINDRRGETSALGSLGLLYTDLGDYAKSIEYLQQSLKLARELKDPERESKTLSNLGNAHFNLGNYLQARQYYEQRLALDQKLGSLQGQAYAYVGLGNVHYARDEYEPAIDRYKAYLALSRQIGSPQDEATALRNLGVTYFAQQKYEPAIQLLNQGLTLHRQQGEKREESEILSNLGFIAMAQGKWAEAEPYFQQSIQLFESLRPGLEDSSQISLFDLQRDTYESLQKVLVEQNKHLPALEIAERGRARAFVELTARRLSNQATANINPPSISDIQQISRQQQATLVQYSIVYQQNPKKLGERLGAASLYIWVIQPSGTIHFRQVDLSKQLGNKTLADLVNTSRSSLGVRGISFRETAAIAVKPLPTTVEQNLHLKKLHKILIEPIADLLPRNPQERVIFIPQDQLFLVAFPALQNEQGTYLIQQHTILTAPAIQVLALTHQHRRRVQTANLQEILIVGNPKMPKILLPGADKAQELTSLPGTEREANRIAQLFKTQALLGPKATKTEVIQRMARSRFIHLATHGLLDDFSQVGIPGAIVLSPDPAEPEHDRDFKALLTANEILNLGQYLRSAEPNFLLNSEMVVLSACDTGVGRVTGDGVVGLSRSLIASGVPSVVVSLWKVPDTPTEFLMTQFYENLQNGSLDKAQALRQAMLSTLASYPDPADWAAFTLVGEAR